MEKPILFLVIVSLIFIVACKKENEPVSLKIYPEHHGAPIYGATAYIEFNTQSSPGALSNYDLKLDGDASKDYILFERIKSGDFYIVCFGYDSTIAMKVFGGTPFEIPEDHSGEFIIEVPVTE